MAIDWDKFAAENGGTPINEPTLWEQTKNALDLSNPSSAASSIISGFGEGASLGTAKFLGAAVNKLVNGGSLTQSYNSVVNQNNESEQSHPILYGASNIAGSAIPLTLIGRPSLPSALINGTSAGTVALGPGRYGYQITSALNPTTNPIAANALAGGISGATQNQPEGYSNTGLLTNTLEGAGAGTLAGLAGRVLPYIGKVYANNSGIYTEDQAMKDALKNGLSKPLANEFDDSLTGEQAWKQYGRQYNKGTNELGQPNPPIEQATAQNMINNGELQKKTPTGFIPTLGNIATGSAIGGITGAGLNAVGVNDILGVPVNPYDAAAVLGFEAGSRPLVSAAVSGLQKVAQKGVSGAAASNLADTIEAHNNLGGIQLINPFTHNVPIEVTPGQTLFTPNGNIYQPPTSYLTNPTGVGTGTVDKTLAGLYNGISDIPAGVLSNTVNQVGQGLGLVQPIGQSLRNLSNSVMGNNNNITDWNSFARDNGGQLVQ